MRDPADIFLIEICGIPSFLPILLFSTIGTAMVEPGNAAIAVGIVCVICMATKIAINHAKITTGSNPINTRINVIGAIVAVSSVPGMIPIMEKIIPPIIETIIACIISMFSTSYASFLL